MKTFKVTFTARLIGSIGKTTKHSETIQGETFEAAKLTLYNKYEHISIIKIKG